eukprot:2040395-Rhodomonas_salina.1
MQSKLLLLSLSLSLSHALARSILSLALSLALSLSLSALDALRTACTQQLPRYSNPATGQIPSHETRRAHTQREKLCALRPLSNKTPATAKARA